MLSLYSLRTTNYLLLDEQVDDREAGKNDDKNDGRDEDESLKTAAALIKAATHVATAKKTGRLASALLEEDETHKKNCDNNLSDGDDRRGQDG